MSLPKKIKAASKSHNERNDCSVKAVAILCNATYDEAHAALKAAGRKDRKGAGFDQIMKAVRSLGCYVEYDDELNHRGRNMHRITVNRVGAALPKGRWLVYSNGHVLAVKNGEVLDWTKGRRHQARLAWEVSL